MHSWLNRKGTQGAQDRTHLPQPRQAPRVGGSCPRRTHCALWMASASGGRQALCSGPVGTAASRLAGLDRAMSFTGAARGRAKKKWVSRKVSV